MENAHCRLMNGLADREYDLFIISSRLLSFVTSITVLHLGFDYWVFLAFFYQVHLLLTIMCLYDLWNEPKLIISHFFLICLGQKGVILHP